MLAIVADNGRQLNDPPSSLFDRMMAYSGPCHVQGDGSFTTDVDVAWHPPSVTEGTTLQAAAEALDQPIAIVNVSAERDIDGAFAAIVQRKVGALIVSSDPLFFLVRKMLVAWMARYALPTVFADREQVEAGGLVSYGASRPDASYFTAHLQSFLQREMISRKTSEI